MSRTGALLVIAICARRGRCFGDDQPVSRRELGRFGGQFPVWRSSTFRVSRRPTLTASASGDGNQRHDPVRVEAGRERRPDAHQRGDRLGLLGHVHGRVILDAGLSKGTVVLCYWDSAKTNKPPDMNAFWNMWKTVVDKYGGDRQCLLRPSDELNMYSTTDLCLAVQQLARAISDRSEEQSHPRRDRRRRRTFPTSALPALSTAAFWACTTTASFGSDTLDQRVPMGQPVPG